MGPVLRLTVRNIDRDVSARVGVRLRFRDAGTWYDLDTRLEVPAANMPAPVPLVPPPAPIDDADLWLDVDTDATCFRGQLRHLMAYYWHLDATDQPVGEPVDHMSHFLRAGREVAATGAAPRFAY